MGAHGWRPSRADVLLAAGVGAGVLVWTVFATAPGARPGWPTGVALIVLGTVLLIGRSRWPVAVLVGELAVVAPYYWLGHPDGPAGMLVLVALYTVAARVSPLRAMLVGTAVLVVWVGVEQVLRGEVVAWPEQDHYPWIAAVVAVGVAVGAARRAQRSAAERAEERTRRRVEQERLRIAREVHDVVSHSLAMIAVQAGVGAHVAGRRPEQAVAALEEIRDGSRAALEELRATLALLRDPAPAGEASAATGNVDDGPAPGLHRLDELVRTAETAGLAVGVHGAAGPLSAPVDAAAFRIVQEAVTNTVRHGRGVARLTIDLERGPATLRVRVRDDGEPAEAPPEHGEGRHGLHGLRERAAALGGHADAGWDTGGFVVDAELPVTPR